MTWTKNYLEYCIILTIVLFPALLQITEGAGECRNAMMPLGTDDETMRYLAQRLMCYDCDSRYDQNCDDPFNRSLPIELRPRTRNCHGCCIKFVHKFPDGEWIQRSCTENIIINYFMVDHVCMSEGKGHGAMCFCESNLCNGASPSTKFSILTNPISDTIVKIFASTFFSSLGSYIVQLCSGIKFQSAL